jgi:nicotinate-nucleotide pyrophosphorylase (carboxylating)
MKIGAIPDFIIEDQIKQIIKADIAYGDISSIIIPEDHKAKAKIIAKSEGIIAGIAVAKNIAKLFNLQIEIRKNDGDTIKKLDEILLISGNTRSILMAERTMLNIMMKMSSIATTVNSMVTTIRNMGLKTIVAATRKTTPGFGFFEKMAFTIGGGDTHRWDLSDMVLLKDTHRDIFNENIEELIKKAKQNTSFSKKIEIEIENPNQVETALNAGADIIMLDNMKPEIIKETITQLNQKYPQRKTLIEASGNIGPNNFQEYAKAGIDIISTSQPIFTPEKVVDLSLKIVSA